MSSATQTFARVACVVLTSLWASAALAQGAHAETVIVLGLTSVDGDDDFARDLTGVLRHTASQVRGWQVSEREVSLAQMSLVHGCDEPDARCLTAIAGALSAQRLVYGSVQRTAATEPYDFSVTISLFNAETGQIERTVTDTIPRNHTDIDSLRVPARRYTTQLAGGPQVGRLIISVQPASAEASVTVDGEEAGTTHDGALTLTSIGAGPHLVQIRARNYETHDARVEVHIGEDALVRATLVHVATAGGPMRPAHPSNAWRSILGWSLVGVGVLFAGLSAYEAITLNSWNNTDTSDTGRIGEFQRYRNAVPTGVDACDAARNNMYGSERQRAVAVDVCDSAKARLSLQWVFAAAAVAAGGAGLYFVLTSGDDDLDDAEARRTRRPRLALTPEMSPSYGGMSATLTF